MREQFAETLIGAAVLAIAALFLMYSLNAADQGGGRGYELNAKFASISGLAVGADVRVSGVKVGAVNRIDLDPSTYQARVSFTVSDGVSVPVDSSVSLKSEGLLGGSYLSVEPGLDAEMLEPGASIEIVQGAIDIFRLLSDLVANLRCE
ncbi:MAG: outer membrane lipid asymmetry maintenance protein MlaD [Caulobacterales bacterium]|nr:outer membrane lipid asymmetry maintenance protein MlaD [Caulobacterales bacterium]